MDKKVYIQFNKIIDKFLDELQQILPEERDIIIFKNQIDVTNMITPNKMLYSFIKFIYPYKQQIIDKNESFFLGDNLNIKQDYLSNAIQLTELWKSKLSDENKEIVWKYFQVMIIISEKAI